MGVLTTDIASPERTQIYKSKFKEAFPPQLFPPQRPILSPINQSSSEVSLSGSSHNCVGATASSCSTASAGGGRKGTGSATGPGTTKERRYHHHQQQQNQQHKQQQQP